MRGRPPSHVVLNFENNAVCAQGEFSSYFYLRIVLAALPVPGEDREHKILA